MLYSYIFFNKLYIFQILTAYFNNAYYDFYEHICAIFEYFVAHKVSSLVNESMRPIYVSRN